MEYLGVGAFFPWWVIWMLLWQKIFQKISQTESKILQPLLKGFEMQCAEGAFAAGSSLAGNNNVSVMGIPLTSCFV